MNPVFHLPVSARVELRARVGVKITVRETYTLEVRRGT